MRRPAPALLILIALLGCDDGATTDGADSFVPGAVDAAIPSGPPLAPRSAERWCDPVGELPARLSETGCFADIATLAPAPDLIPYEVNAPLWSDGTGKRRFVALPPGARIGVSAGGTLEWPVGTVLVKTFETPTRPVEVRLLLKRTSEPRGWAFAGYRVEGDEGRWVEEWEHGTVEIEGAERAWLYPEAEQCGYCHGAAPEVVLGPTPGQLDRVVDGPNGAYDQLDALVEIGALATRPPVPAPMPDPADESAPLEARARAYLHANCAHCHQPGGWTPPELDLDLRFDTPIGAARLCGVPLQYTSFFAQGALRLDPGRPGNSNVFTRMLVEGDGRMPPLGTGVIDAAGAAVVRAWIASLEGCPD